MRSWRVPKAARSGRGPRANRQRCARCLMEGAADLGVLILGDLAACLGGVEVVAATVGVEALGIPLSVNTCFSARKPRPGRPNRSRWWRRPW